MFHDDRITPLSAEDDILVARADLAIDDSNVISTIDLQSGNFKVDDIQILHNNMARAISVDTIMRRLPKRTA